MLAGSQQSNIFTALLTKGCGEENNDEDCSHTDESLSDVSGTGT